jgi:phosphoglycerate kinase
MIAYLGKVKPSLLTGTALVRLDFNTENDWRMRAALPTLKLLVKTSSKIVIVSHRGRPDHGLIRANKTMPPAVIKKFGLRKDAVELSRLLKKKVVFIEHFDPAKIRATVESAAHGSIFLLENLRFLPGEEKNDPTFAKALASIADFYVNDAFAVSHRADASIAAITKFLPSYAGLELENEIKFLSRAMMAPHHPLVIILGGAKASDKLGVIAHFKKKADWFLLGGGPANTILAARGMDVKKSLKDDDPKNSGAIKKTAGYKNVILPTDFKWHGDAILDVGPKTISAFIQKIATARTIIWSGPLGVTDRKPYNRASAAVARAITRNKKAFSIVGGGETVMFLKKIELDKKFSFVSTGGGAMMDFLAGEKLPGIEALKKCHVSSIRYQDLK